MIGALMQENARNLLENVQKWEGCSKNYQKTGKNALKILGSLAINMRGAQKQQNWKGGIDFHRLFPSLGSISGKAVIEYTIR